jgi:nicotinamide-nucleotide amidase
LDNRNLLMFDNVLRKLAATALEQCRKRKLKLVTAESCTGGLIAGCLTAIAGSSDVLDCGFITYSNRAKSELLGVPRALIARHGAVSEAVSKAMAKGALARSGAGIAIACTGIAGPTGGSAAKPVGRVHIALAWRGKAVRHAKKDYGAIGRDAVRRDTVRDALAMLVAALGVSAPGKARTRTPRARQSA